MTTTRDADALDLAVVGQDPWFGYGVRAQLEPFWHAARDLRREPRLLYLSRTHAISLRGLSFARTPRRELEPPFEGLGVRSFLPELDALSQVEGSRRLARIVARSRSAWVVATTASFGYAAARSGRSYACWIGTGLDEEWDARRPGLARSRRLALAANAPVLRRLERETLRRAARVYATSPASRRSVARAGGLDEAKVGVLPIPVDVARFAPEPDETWRARLERPVLAFVGRADDPRKNLRLLVEAFAAVRERLPEARLRLIGRPPDGPLRRGLGPGVEVLGEIPAVEERLREASLFVLPSRQEGFGVAACQALACGVPVLTTPSGGPEELVRASGGGRVLTGFGVDELAETALALLESEPTLVELRRRGREYVVGEHSPERFRERLARAMAELDARA